MSLGVVVAGATGWVGEALIPAIAAADDLFLAGAVARSAAGRQIGGVTATATLAEALATPSDVVVDYTRPGVVKGHTLAALESGRHVVIGTSGLGPEDFAEIDAAARANGRGVIAAGNFAITQAFSTKLSMTFFSPALSKLTVSLLPSMAAILP
jgi:4-hydroxy-tetrahydrodipicolinate reductase